MGVRLTILDEQDNILFYGSKLFGYEASETLTSLKYLWDIKSDYLIKDRGYEDFDDFAISIEAYTYCDKLCKLSIPELKEFIKLYDEDLIRHDRDYSIAEEVEKAIPTNVEYVWLEWG